MLHLMTSSDLDRLQTLYRQIESLLEQGDTSSPELARLFVEVSRLQSGEDVWCNLDPKGVSDLTRLDAQYRSENDNGPGSASGWR
jgi:hypothetical protein